MTYIYCNNYAMSRKIKRITPRHQIHGNVMLQAVDQCHLSQRSLKLTTISPVPREPC